MVELEIGQRLGSGWVEGGSLIFVLERRAARGEALREKGIDVDIWR